MGDSLWHGLSTMPPAGRFSIGGGKRRPSVGRVARSGDRATTGRSGLILSPLSSLPSPFSLSPSPFSLLPSPLSLRLSPLAPLVRLPHLPAADVQRRQPAVAVAPGVDALEVAEVEDLAALLRGVADDGRLARTVRAGLADLQRVPEERLRAAGPPSGNSAT